jgi:hypothetical protein
MSDLVILNDFGITPTKNFVAAGYDFYVPNIKLKDENDTEEIYKILTEFSKSFKTPLEETDFISGATVWFLLISEFIEISFPSKKEIN